MSDSGVVTTERTGDVDVKEDRVNRIRLSYDNINREIKESHFGFEEAEIGAIGAFVTNSWDFYVTDGKVNPNGRVASFEITKDGVTVKGGLTIDPKCDQTLNEAGKPPAYPVVEYVVCAKDDPECQYYGDMSRVGKVYTTSYTDKTHLIYRTALEKDASVKPESVKTDPVEGLKCFTIKYGDQEYTIKKLDEDNNNGNNDGGWWAVANSDGSGDVLRHIKVTQNTDKSFTIAVNDDSTNQVSDYQYYDRKVFNVSANGKSVTSYYHETPLEVTITTSDATVAQDDKNNDLTAYQYLALGADDKNADTTAADSIYLLADTGELVFGSNVADTLGNLKDIPGVDTISVIYDKSEYKDGDLRPEHYFDVKLDDDNHNMFDLITYDSHNQDITYTVGTNQNVKINTNAEDVFDTQIKREMDDILTAIDEYNAIEAKVNKLKGMQEDITAHTETDMEKIKTLLKAANKELDIAKNKLQRTYENAISQFGKFFDQANQAETACGTVEHRLELVSNRLSEEKTTVSALASDNENVDITNIAVEVSEANLVYNAALMATGRISKQTLVDYI